MQEFREPAKVEDLERILKHLPEPVSVTLELGSYLDFSKVFQQVAGGKYKGRNGQLLNDATFLLENPSKSDILDIYARCEKGLGGVSFKEAHFRSGDVDIVLTPYELKASYTEKEPKIVSELRDEIEGMHPIAALTRYKADISQ